MGTKLLKAAKAAKTDGYTHLTSVVKQVFRTTYYHVVSIDEIINNGGRWPAAQSGSFPGKGGSSWHGPCGTNTVPEKSINKSAAIRRYC